ncbi:MAG: hypothetical protein H0T41_15545, partial [Rhodobacteraceae bacterium]|nr:hypothetical protein [Paracoccaceae bacterium]
MSAPLFPVPRFSVIVPVWRQWDALGLLLGDLAAQALPAEDFETLIVDNEPGAAAPRLALPANARLV